MLTSEKLNELLQEYSVPARHSHFSKEVTPPFITWIAPQTDNMFSDNVVYARIQSFQVELYTRVDTIDEQNKLENYFDSCGFTWNRTGETWLDEEKVMMTVYDVS